VPFALGFMFGDLSEGETCDRKIRRRCASLWWVFSLSTPIMRTRPSRLASVASGLPEVRDKMLLCPATSARLCGRSRSASGCGAPILEEARLRRAEFYKEVARRSRADLLVTCSATFISLPWA
jgi:hypothetical protein